jgi:hypothetical protein
VRGERPLSEVLARRIGFGRARLRCGRKAFAGAKALEYGCVQRRLVAEPSGWGLNAGIWARLAGKARYKTRTPLNRTKTLEPARRISRPNKSKSEPFGGEAVVRSFGSLALPKESSPITSHLPTSRPSPIPARWSDFHHDLPQPALARRGLWCESRRNRAALELVLGSRQPPRSRRWLALIP